MITRMCPLCEEQITDTQFEDLLLLSCLQQEPQCWVKVEGYLKYNPVLEEKGFVISHETDTGLFLKVFMKSSKIEVDHFSNGSWKSYFEVCNIICTDFSYHCFVLGKEKGPEGPYDL